MGHQQSENKINYIVSLLAPKIATEVHDLTLEPPSDTPYNKLKGQLIKKTAPSEHKRLQHLFNAEELGDRKLLQLLCRMQQLLGDKAQNTDDTYLCEQFLQCILQSVRMVLASTSDPESIDDVVLLSDKIMEVAVLSSSIATINTNLELVHASNSPGF